MQCAPFTSEVGTKEKPIMQIRTLAEAISHYGRHAHLLTVAARRSARQSCDDRASSQ